MKTFEEFKADIANGDFKAEMEELAKTLKDKTEREKDSLVSEFAKKLGYDVSVEDLAVQKAAAREMSDEEMEAVAGGGGYSCSGLDWCGKDYLCVVLWNI